MAKGDIILHFGVNKTIQGIIFIKKNMYFWPFKIVVVLRAKFRQKIILICQIRTSWQPCSVTKGRTQKLPNKFKIVEIY
jgi:hypothetical protein